MGTEELIDLTSWRVSAGVRAQRISEDIDALEDPDGSPARAAGAFLEKATKVIQTSQEAGWRKKLWRTFSGSDVEHAWQLLKQAEEEVMLAKTTAELIGDAPWLCEVARLSCSPARADDLCMTMQNWAPDHGHRPNPEMAAGILAADHEQSNAAHAQTRGLRNMLYLAALIVLAFDVIVWRLGLGFGGGRLLLLGALGGALAMVFAVTKGSPVTPYNLALPQFLLKIVSGGAVAIAALVILNATFHEAISSADAMMYALVFGFSQQLFTRLVDDRAAVLKDATAPKATKAKKKG